jgi:hypothetical protein
VEAQLQRDAQALIVEEQASLERVGVFGTLTVGFCAAVAMALGSLLLHSAASLRERRYRFAVLRALGMGRATLACQVALEYGCLTLYGAAAGAAVGALTAQLFTPFFRSAGAAGVSLPPLVPVIAWQAITPLALAFAGGALLIELAVVAAALGRVRPIARG